MKLDVLGLLGACSYALDCVEAELVHVTDKHAKRVAYMSVCMAEQMGIEGESLQDLTACALLHDNALTQYMKKDGLTQTLLLWWMGVLTKRIRLNKVDLFDFIKS